MCGWCEHGTFFSSNIHRVETITDFLKRCTWWVTIYKKFLRFYHYGWVNYILITCPKWLNVSGQTSKVIRSGRAGLLHACFYCDGAQESRTCDDTRHDPASTKRYAISRRDSRWIHFIILYNFLFIIIYNRIFRKILPCLYVTEQLMNDLNTEHSAYSCLVIMKITV